MELRRRFKRPLNLLPKTKKIAITSKNVYNYRYGGGTSKFMPYMLDIELINIVFSYFQMCKYPGLFNDSKLNNVILKCINLEEVKDAVSYLDKNNNLNKLSYMLKNKDISAINRYLNQDYNNNRINRLIKKIFEYPHSTGNCQIKK